MPIVIDERRDVEQAQALLRSRPDFDWHAEHVKIFKRTIRALQLDHSQFAWRSVSWIVGLFLIVVIPVLRLLYVNPADDEYDHQLVFQPITVVVAMLISGISFIFLSQSMRTHGVSKIIFLDTIEEEAAQIKEEYSKIVRNGALKLSKLLLPATILYVLHKCWFYSKIPLAALPGVNDQRINIAIISASVGISWLFQATTFLYACVLFWKVCYLQELKMKVFKESLLEGYDPEFYFQKYTSIIKNLQLTSRRFRSFLALTGSVTVFSALASMYEVIAHRNGISPLMSGELVILNLVNLTGIGLCLKSASKVAHLHRRIVKAASAMHARITFASSRIYSAPQEEVASPEFQAKMESFWQAQDAWSRRSALVNFLSNNSAGISVYGFVLDRFFVHTSIGALLTTTWFILGRSLGS
eukprot:TRINITY_DN9976_c0_g1_i1.p1 TRINITY_DN9976_c0_g1~~TRINITY_DN9976_c0_g1_i1.p1  ORF type:complete len:413 (-),score=35.19 TRINITY_DN9976_c0_g1_i1:201-1439(-)